jgi:hypothetical protein
MTEQRADFIRRIQKRLEAQFEDKPMPDDDKLQQWALLEIAAQLDELKLMLGRVSERRIAA